MIQPKNSLANLQNKESILINSNTEMIQPKHREENVISTKNDSIDPQTKALIASLQ